MAQQSRWETCHVACPEGRGEASLFVEWRAVGEEELLNSVSCDNPYLRDYSGGDCSWSCWGKITSKKM